MLLLLALLAASGDSVTAQFWFLYVFIDSSVFVYPFFSFFPDFFISFNYFMLHMLLFKVAVVPHMLALPSCTGSLVSSFFTFQQSVFYFEVLTSYLSV